MNIKSYWIMANDDGTYSLEISTPEYSINYDKVNITFSSLDNIAFPVLIETLDEEGNKCHNYSLTKNQNKEE